MHDAHAALLGDCNRKTRLGDGVHRSRYQWQVQCDVAGETGGEAGVLRKDLGERWNQQHIVEGQRFAEKAHVKAPKIGLYP